MGNYKIVGFKVKQGLGIKYAFRNFKEENDEISRENLREKGDENEGKRDLQMGNLGQQEKFETLLPLKL